MEALESVKSCNECGSWMIDVESDVEAGSAAISGNRIRDREGRRRGSMVDS